MQIRYVKKYNNPYYPDNWYKNDIYGTNLYFWNTFLIDFRYWAFL